jgi:hypothetical protein
MLKNALGRRNLKEINEVEEQWYDRGCYISLFYEDIPVCQM